MHGCADHTHPHHSSSGKIPEPDRLTLDRSIPEMLRPYSPFTVLYAQSHIKEGRKEVRVLPLMPPFTIQVSHLDKEVLPQNFCTMQYATLKWPTFSSYPRGGYCLAYVLYLPTRKNGQIYALLAHTPIPISYVVWLRDILKERHGNGEYSIGGEDVQFYRFCNKNTHGVKSGYSATQSSCIFLSYARCSIGHPRIAYAVEDCSTPNIIARVFNESNAPSGVCVYVLSGERDRLAGSVHIIQPSRFYCM